MQYRIQINRQEITITQDEYEDLRDGLRRHDDHGFRDGETRCGCVIITECAGLPRR